MKQYFLRKAALARKAALSGVFCEGAAQEYLRIAERFEQKAAAWPVGNTDIYYSYEQLEDMFPTDDDGNVISITEAAWSEVFAFFGHDFQRAEIKWKTPGCFDVRYGSSYVATASLGDMSMRFHNCEGDFREGDDE